MSNRINYRRGDARRTEHGPTWENLNPGAGCNSTHVARGRRNWKRRNARRLRRTGSTWTPSGRRTLPPIHEEEDDVLDRDPDLR